MIHDLLKGWSCPNAMQTWEELLTVKSVHEIVFGISYLWLVPNSHGKTAEVWCLHPSWVKPVYTNAHTLCIDYYEVGHPDRGLLKIPVSQIRIGKV